MTEYYLASGYKLSFDAGTPAAVTARTGGSSGEKFLSSIFAMSVMVLALLMR